MVFPLHELPGAFLPRPLEVTVTDVTRSSISIRWTRGWNWWWWGGGGIGYRVFVNDSSVDSTEDTSYTFTNLACGTSYALGVAVSDADGFPLPTASGSATTDECEDLSPPTMPGNLRVTLATPSSVSIAWDASSDNVGVVGYGIYSGGRRIDSTSATSYTLQGLGCDTTLLLGVDAFDAAGNRSPTIVMLPRANPCPDTTPPTRPENLRVTLATPSSVSIAWDASRDDVRLVGYGIYSGGDRIDSTAGTSYSLGGLSCGTTRLLAVDAFDAAGNRSPVAVVTASTDGCEDKTPPTMPGNLHVSGTTVSSITVAWDASSDDVGVAGYGVYSGDTRIDSTVATSYTLGGLQCGTTRLLSVDAFDAAGNRSPIAVALAITEACPDTTAPTIPGNLHVTAVTAISVTIAWDASSDDVGVAGYGVYSGDTRIDSTGATSYTLGGLQCGTTRLLSVDAFDAAGNRSPPAEVTARTSSCPDASAPTTPANLRVSGSSTSSVTVAWDASTDDVGVAGYGIYVAGSQVDSTGATSYTLGGLQCGTTRLLAVDAFDAAGNRSAPVEVTATTDACPDTGAPTTPANLRVSGSSTSSVTVAWDASTDDVGVSGYGIYVAGTRIDSTGANSYTVSGLPCGSSRTLGVDAYDAAGNRSPMAVVLATTDACPDTAPPTTPGNLRVTGSSTTSVTVAWDAASDDVAVAGYGIYVSGIRIDSTSATSYTLGGLLCGTSRLLTVDAYDAAGNRSQQASVNAGTAACEDTAPPPIAGLGYTMAFHDEFDTLGSLAWGESNWFSDNPTSQVFVDNGVLNLVSRRADGYPNITLSGQASPISFMQGYFEARMRWTKGPGAWPAFWLLSQRHLSNPVWPEINPYCAEHGLPAAECWSAELDVFEGQGTEPTTFYGTVHRNSAEIYGVGDSQNENNAHDVGIDLTADFHTYGMLWTATEIRWYLDGQFVHSAPVYDSTNQPMYLLLDLWIGGWTTGTDETTPDELKAEVDWVRVWQK